jgi:PhoH-like ATPase
MDKTYVLDTNVLLHDPTAYLNFQENDVVIPLAVIEEIDEQKRRQDEIGRNARFFSREIDALRSQGHLARGIQLPGGGKLRVELNHADSLEFPKGLDTRKYDNRILCLALNLMQQDGLKVILVSKDLNLRIKADVMGIPAEDYRTDKVDSCNLYKGYREIYLSEDDFQTFFKKRWLAANIQPEPYPHEFCILKNPSNGSQSALAKYHMGRLLPLTYGEKTIWGITARNKEQKFAFDLLMDDSVQVVTLVGGAGTGKTLLALAAGLEKVVEERVYRRFLIIRPLVPMGEDLGYLPGSKDEKLRPWMAPIFDNFEHLFQQTEESSTIMAELTARGLIEMETLTYIRGRSIPNQFILCDEAQNLTPNMIKTLVTRVGEHTKLIFTGDPDQIDHPYLDASSNGLTYLVERFKEGNITGHVTLTKGERSEVAELGARLL